MSFSRNIVDLPLILCGPILRRVEADSVSVFIALKSPRTIKLIVNGVNDFKGERSTIALGEHLHVVVVTATAASDKLSPGGLYTYNLVFREIGSASGAPNEQNLKDHQAALLGVSYGLSYGSAGLTSFLMPPDNFRELRIVHGSCRKPHGGGHDMLAPVDSMIADEQLRPHQLFLTGDQIYADDVHATLLRAVYETAQKLLGWSEVIPLSGGPDAELNEPWASSRLRYPPQDGYPSRGDILKEQAKYSSGHKEAHIMFLGEFYTMYLMAWSDVFWTDAVKDEPKLNWFAKTLPNVRRVLANIPTYMIFDDHDVTDDWNFDGEWVQDVRGKILGRRMLRNALLAYAVFQDWGNQPLHYPKSGTKPGAKLLDSLRFSGPNSPQIASQPAMMCETLGIGEVSTADPDKRKHWHYAVSGPAHRVIVLDTRTWREYDMPDEGVGLIKQNQLQEQLGGFLPSNPLTLVVSPAPVIGLPLVEGAQNAYARLDRQAADDEAWMKNRTIFEVLLALLAPLGRVVILSGDVHYGFSHSMAYYAREGDAFRCARIVQLCASSLKNAEIKTYAAGALERSTRDKNIFAGWDVQPAPDVKAKVRQILQEHPSLFLDLVWRRRLNKPVVIQAPKFLPEFIFNLSNTFGKPDREYAITYHNDERPWAKRANDYRELDTPGVTTAGPQTLISTLTAPNKIVGYTNIGLVDFKISDTSSPGSPKPLVRHRLGWHPAAFTDDKKEQAAKYSFFTEHIISLAPPGEDERPGAI